VTFDLPVLAPAPAAFAFSCNRCGRCCSNGTGVVWVEPDEIAPLAAALGETPEAFARRRLRAIDGRLSLLERDGRCSLLMGSNECAAYGARPRQCREFPFWSDVLAGGEPFDRAREICPGIHVVPPPAEREAAYADLRAFYARADARIAAHKPRCVLSGDCCDFETAGHRLFATLLEVDYFAEHAPRLGPAEREGWCEAYRGRRCAAREPRPLACRTYFCDATTSEALRALHEEALSELHAIERRHRYPQGYGDFVELLPARRAAIELLDARRAASKEPS